MADIIKTWPRAVSAAATARMFSEKSPAFCRYYFALGRGRPKQEVDRLWFTYLGRIIGYFRVDEIVVNDGTLPRLNRLDGTPGEWQIAKDAYVAICNPPAVRLKDRVFMDGFRGFRYFDIDEYRKTPDSRYRC